MPEDVSQESTDEDANESESLEAAGEKPSSTGEEAALPETEENEAQAPVVEDEENKE